MAWSSTTRSPLPYEVVGRHKVQMGEYTNTTVSSTGGLIASSLSKISWGWVLDNSSTVTTKSRISDSFPITSGTATIVTVGSTISGVYYFVEF